MAVLQIAIEARETARFAEAYRRALEGCYACHKASDKPFLRPHAPRTAPVRRIINVDANTKWPR